jgi:hypothetical protein
MINSNKKKGEHSGSPLRVNIILDAAWVGADQRICPIFAAKKEPTLSALL